MNAYIYNADIYCFDCGNAIKKEIIKSGKQPADFHDESSYDSDEFPKGPFPDGGGESDSPQHCGSGVDCINAHVWNDGTKSGCFLENDLTADGVKFVKEMYRDDPNEVTKFWMDYYRKAGYDLAEAKGGGD